MTEAEKQAIGSRFKSFRNDYIKLSQTSLSEELGITQKTLSFIETGTYLPSQKTVTYLSKKYKLDSDWLLRGKGEPVSSLSKDETVLANLQTTVAFLRTEVKELRDIIKEIQDKLSQEA